MISAPVRNAGNKTTHHHGAPMPYAISLSVAAISLTCCTLLAGCGLGSQGSVATAPVAVAGVHLQGSVHGGQQPVVGANVQLYAAGSTGYGSAYTYSSGTSLLGLNVVNTDTAGGFNISNDYTCPSASTLVYLVATGGDPGIGSTNNPNIAVMAALGPCGNLSSATFISVNELTTVASVWALSPFMTGIANIGTSPANALGLANAFATVNKLVNIGSGATAGTTLPAGAILPITKINTLADILASCINSSGGAAGDTSTNCGTLFSATATGSVTPTDTITAAMLIAQNPTTHVATLAGLASPTAPFLPTLTTTPNDFSLVVTYTAGGISSPSGLAVDSAQNIWITNAAANTVTQMDNIGTPLSGSAGYSVDALNMPAAIAVDQGGYAWVANKGNATVSKIAPGGVSASTYTVGSMPASISIDAYGNAWTANNAANSLSRISPNGTVLTVSTTGVAAPVGIAIDPK
jgi:hypothetical protein